MGKIKKETLVNISKAISKLEGAGEFVESDGSISFNGLNQKTYDKYREKNKLPKQDVRKAKYGEFLNILDDFFIQVHGIDKLPEDILPVVAETSWNSGPDDAARLVQQTVGAEPDGIIGPKTLKKIEEYRQENDFLDGFSNQRAQFILDSREPSVIQNRNGLLNRVESSKQLFR